jgi:cytochrome c-type biogenesis protein CcmH
LNPQLLFLVLASVMVAVALAVVLPFVWRGARDSAPGHLSRPWLATTAFALGLPALACGLYAMRGDWDAISTQRSTLSEQWLDDALPPGGETSEQMQAELERHLQRQPNDPRALVLKARLEMRAQRYPQAAAAFEKAVAGHSKAAKDPGVWVEYAEARAMAQGGTLVGEPRQLVHKALALDAQHAQALDLAGSAAWERRDFAAAASHWQRLLAQLPAGTPRHAELSQAIERAQQRARLSLPSAP